MRCEYLLIAMAESIFTVTFTDLDIEARMEGGCFDYVQVFLFILGCNDIVIMMFSVSKLYKRL